MNQNKDKNIATSAINNKSVFKNRLNFDVISYV